MFAPAKFFTTFAIAASVVAVSPAFAQDFVSNGRTQMVSYADLDLSSAEGQKELQNRIRRATAHVCATSDRQTYDSCRDLASAHVRGNVDTAIASAASSNRYADAKAKDVMVGN